MGSLQNEAWMTSYLWQPCYHLHSSFLREEGGERGREGEGERGGGRGRGREGEGEGGGGEGRERVSWVLLRYDSHTCNVNQLSVQCHNTVTSTPLQ